MKELTSLVYIDDDTVVIRSPNHSLTAPLDFSLNNLKGERFVVRIVGTCPQPYLLDLTRRNLDDMEQEPSV